MAAGALIKAGTPAACSPVSSAQAAHTAALPRTIQYVKAETPSKCSVRNTRTACGTASRHESAAPHHASNSTTEGHLHQSIMKLRRWPSVQIPSGFLASAEHAVRRGSGLRRVAGRRRRKVQPPQAAEHVRRPHRLPHDPDVRVLP
jgi:hypothetical protein